LITLTLPSTQTVADLRQQANGLTVDMDPMRLPQVLRRRLDVSDFATPVQAVTSTQAGERVRIAIETSGKWEFSSVQIGNSLTIEVKPPPQKSRAR
jgi:type IV pilus assembly protein PilQ